MARFLVDVTCTFEIECGSPADFERVLAEALDPAAILSALASSSGMLDLRSWRVDDDYTVLES